jgi:hypothetical protein
MLHSQTARPPAKLPRQIEGLNGQRLELEQPSFSRLCLRIRPANCALLESMDRGRP